MPFLPEAVKSILTQTLKDFRLLLIDDGSTDDSARFLETVRDSRIVVVHQENLGLGATLNRAINLCETKYFARMDADDIALPERLEKQLAFMETHQEVVILGTQLAFLCNGWIVPHATAPVDHTGIVRRLKRGTAGLGHSTLMCRTASIKRIGGYRIAGAGQDIDFCLRMCEAGRAANLSEVLLRYRLHTSSIAMTRWSEIRRAHSYAIHCTKRRRLHQPEPSFKEFCIKWDRWRLLHQLVDAISAWGHVHYRKGIMSKASGHKGTTLWHFLCAAIAQPRSAFFHSFATLTYLIRQYIIRQP